MSEKNQNPLTENIGGGDGSQNRFERIFIERYFYESRFSDREEGCPMNRDSFEKLFSNTVIDKDHRWYSEIENRQVIITDFVEAWSLLEKGFTLNLEETDSDFESLSYGGIINHSHYVITEALAYDGKVFVLTELSKVS